MILQQNFTVFCLAAALTLSGCAGGSLFGSTSPKPSQEMEEIGTRRAKPEEEKRLDACLHYIFKKQQAHFARARTYEKSLRALQPESQCGKISLSLEAQPESYRATARIRDGESTVMWSVDETGNVVEHDDLSFDFSL